MENIKLPLKIEKGRFFKSTDVIESIDANLALLIHSPQQLIGMDPQFGFVFNNLRFEIFNENMGVVFNSKPDDNDEEDNFIYEKKISGLSRNINTFAANLADLICNYEPRLDDVAVTMTYLRQERMISLVVKATMKNSGKPYRYKSQIKIWN